MGRMKDQWIATHEKLCEEFWSDEISETTFKFDMQSLGFDDDEIQNHIEAKNEDNSD